MEPKVSILIPTYNVEKYVNRAIESSLNQIYKNIEVIIVDDGSTDNTWKVIEKYSKNNENIHAFRQKNSGVSCARNKAIQMATGDYVIFLDSDDWLENNTVLSLMKRAKTNENYLISSDCYFAYFDENGNIYKEQSIEKNFEIKIDGKNALLASLGTEYKLKSACYKLFSMKIIKEHKIAFDTNIYYGEDGLFVFTYLHYVEGIDYSTEPLWNILERPNSATTSPYNNSWLTAIDAVEKMKKFNDDDEIQKELDVYMVSRSLTVLRRALETEINEQTITGIKYLRMRIKEVKKIYLKRKMKLKHRIYFHTMVYMPIYCLSYILKRRK